MRDRKTFLWRRFFFLFFSKLRSLVFVSNVRFQVGQNSSIGQFQRPLSRSNRSVLYIAREGRMGCIIRVATTESQDAGRGWYELQDRRLLRFISGQRINRPPLCTNLRNNWYAMGSRAQTRMGFNTAVALNVQHRTEYSIIAAEEWGERAANEVASGNTTDAEPSG